jgi:hypothetical protein
MLDHSLTPRMTRHALERCQEMGIPARLAKGIYRRPAVVRPAPKDGRDGWIVVSDLFPDYAVVVFLGRDGYPTIATVVFRTTEDYARKGTTYTTKDQ